MSTFTTPSQGNDQDALYPSITTFSPPNLYPFTKELGSIYFNALKE